MCNNSLEKSLEYICLSCLSELPISRIQSAVHNDLYDKISALSKVEGAAYYLEYSKNTKIKQLLYAIKYYGNKQMCVFLGTLFGEALIASIEKKNVDAIVYVPLHKTKQKRRGYNQSCLIALGIQKYFHVPVLDNVFERVVDSESQTKKNRQERIQQVSKVFRLKNPERIEGKTILLVDDVFTTGATLSTLINLLDGLNVNVYITPFSMAE